MVPLAITSTAGMIRRLGGRRWSQLHRLVYATAVVGVTHYWWLVKADVPRAAYLMPSLSSPFWRPESIGSAEAQASFGN